MLRDISEIGMACDAPAPVDEMTLVSIDFALPGQTERHHVTGAVVRCGGIDHVDERKRRAIHDYIAGTVVIRTNVEEA